MAQKKVTSILDAYPEYEATIGIEVHVQLSTESKIFCTCPNAFGKTPNTNVCPVCAGYPGTLPVLNKQVVEYATMAGLATNCDISPRSRFSRKHYMYPDLPKNYQTTQGEVAICHNGWVPAQTIDGGMKKVRIERIHMEEDAGKNTHMPNGKSLVDINRAGTPLLEIVSAPDISNATEAKSYLMNLRSIMQYIGVSDVNMEEGSFRADINISVKKKSDDKLGIRSEVKNVNSFKFIGMAIEYEIQRKIELLEEGKPVQQDTRLWNEKEQVTKFMRAKSDADDYRYFPCPDLPWVTISEDEKRRVQGLIPELPVDKQARFERDLGLSQYDASILVTDKLLAHYFESACATHSAPKLIANWIIRDVLGYLKEHKLDINQFPITAENLAGLVKALDTDVINSKAAQEVFVDMAATGKTADEVIASKGLQQISSPEQLEPICRELVEANPDVVEKIKGGNDRMFGFFVGQAMKATQGKANPKLLNEILKKLIG